VIPDPLAMKLIGKEMVSQTRGGPKSKLAAAPSENIVTILRSAGSIVGIIDLGGIVGDTYRRIVVVATPAGEYTTGIKKAISPQGELWEPLSPATLKHRRFKGNSRGETFILRETGDHLYNTVKILNTTLGKTRMSEVRVGWTGPNAAIAMAHERGFFTSTKWFGRDPADAHQVPARRLIGLSDEIRYDVIIPFLRSFLK